MKVLVSRSYREKETLGYGVVLDGSTKVFEFNTIELPQKGNQKNISCIPEGTYTVHKITSPTKGKCFQVMNVPNRTAILLHIGNYVVGKQIDSQGCLLVGNGFEDRNKDGNIDVINSSVTLKKLLELLPNEFQIIII